jgi:hypothetical protein
MVTRAKRGWWTLSALSCTRDLAQWRSGPVIVEYLELCGACRPVAGSHKRPTTNIVYERLLTFARGPGDQIRVPRAIDNRSRFPRTRNGPRRRRGLSLRRS